MVLERGETGVYLLVDAHLGIMLYQMKTLIFTALLFIGLSCTSSKSQEPFSTFDFLPINTKDAEAKGFSKIDFESLQKLPIPKELNISSLYKTQKNDTVMELFFSGEKIAARSLQFSYKSFDSSVLYTNLRKIGDLILHEKTDGRGPIGAFRKGQDVYFVFKGREKIGLLNRPGIDKTQRTSGPLIEPARNQ